MRLFSNRDDINAREEFYATDFGMLKSTLVYQGGGRHPITIDGVHYNSWATINYYDAGSAFPEGDNPDGWVADAGYNRRFILAGNDLGFTDGIPSSGNIEAIVFANVNEDHMVGVVGLEDLSAAEFYQAWMSDAAADDIAWTSQILGGESGIVEGTPDGDQLTGGANGDHLRGLAGDDELAGGGGRDTLDGGGGSDTLSGGGGRDRLKGGGGADTLDGGGGADRLNGGRGGDRLDGGRGDDVLSGGGGNDHFVFHGDFGDDVVRDFRTAGRGEKIDLSEVSTIRHFRDLKNNHLSENADGDAVISDGLGNSITLESVAITDLSANDFLF